MASGPGNSMQNERAQELVLADPAMLIHQHAMHQRNLAGRAAERQDADLCPDGERYFEGRRNALAFGHAALVSDCAPCRNDGKCGLPLKPRSCPESMIRKTERARHKDARWFRHNWSKWR